MELLRARPGTKRLSVLGVSLGGLYARYAIALLFQHHWFRSPEDGRTEEAAGVEAGREGPGAAVPPADAPVDEVPVGPDDPDRRIELCNFVTVVSPATGVRGHLAGVIDFAVTSVGVIGYTGPDLALSRAGWSAATPARVTQAGSVHVPSAGGLLDPAEGSEAQEAWRAAATAVGADVEESAPRAKLGAHDSRLRASEDGKETSVAADAWGSSLPDGSEAVPLLLRMTRIGSVFWRAFSAFRSRVVVAVTAYDDKVPYRSAALSSEDTELLRRLSSEHASDHDSVAEGAPRSRPATALAEEDPATFAVDVPGCRASLGLGPLDGLRSGTERGEASSFPHVTGVFLQAPPAAGLRGAAESALQWISAIRGEREASPEDVMAACLRSAGSLTTVHLTFNEWGAAAMNHMRAANNSWLPWDSSGEDAVRFVAERCVLA